MEQVRLNERTWLATVTPNKTGGFLVQCAGMFTVPTGYRVELEWRFKRHALTVRQCLRCPAGENETWLWLDAE